MYYDRLLEFVFKNIKLTNESKGKFIQIKFDLYKEFKKYYDTHYYIRRTEPQNAIFRYAKEYSGFTEYETNSELPIGVAISEYKRYLEYKEKEYNKKRCKK